MTHRIQTTLALLIVPLLAAAFSFSGYVVDMADHFPLPGVEIKLSYPETSDSVVSVSVTDSSGAFLIDNLPNGRVRIMFTHQDYEEKSVEIPLQNNISGFIMPLTKLPPVDNTDATALDELVVTADILKQYADHDVMYLSAANRNYGVNALDAISSLPLFISDVNADNLRTASGKDVDVIINGRRATFEELKNLKGSDVLKVEYYENPPAKFAPFSSTALVNVILKQPSKLKVTGNISAFSSLRYPNAGGNIGIVLTDPKNYLNIFDAGQFFNVNNPSGYRTTYDYEDLTNIYSVSSGKYKRTQNNLSASYQWLHGNNIFFANITYTTQKSNTLSPKQWEQITPSQHITDGSQTESLYSHLDMLSLDLYYSHTFNRGNSLSVDIVNSLNKSASTTDYMQHDEDNQIIFEYDFFSRNRVYSMIANVMYDHPLPNGRFSASLKNHYVKLSQNFQNGFLNSNSALNRNISDMTDADVSYAGQFGKFTLNANMTLQNNYNSLQGVVSINKFYFKPKILLKYNPVNPLTLYAHAWIETLINSMGRQNDNITYVDTYYLQQNNPDVKDNMRYCESLSFQLLLPLPHASTLLIGGGPVYRYTPSPYMELVSLRELETDGRREMYYVSRPEKLSFLNEVEYSLYLNWQKGTKFSITPSLYGIHTAYNTPSEKIRFNNIRLQLETTYSFNRFNTRVYVRTPSKSYSGNRLRYTGWAAGASLNWQYRDFFASLKYNYTQPDSWSLTEVPGFSYKFSEVSLITDHSIMLTIGYSFVCGNKQTNTNMMKKLNNAESETGL